MNRKVSKHRALLNTIHSSFNNVESLCLLSHVLIQKLLGIHVQSFTPQNSLKSLRSNTHGTRCHLTSCHWWSMAWHAHPPEEEAWWETDIKKPCSYLPVWKCERLAQPRVALFVVLVEVQPEAQALQGLIVAAGQLEKKCSQSTQVLAYRSPRPATTWKRKVRTMSP